VLNVIAVNPSAASFLTVWPTGSSIPAVSNLVFPAQTTIANRVIVPLGTNDEVSIYNNAGRSDVIVDLDGYFADTETEPTGSCSASLFAGVCDGNFYWPLITPERVVDTEAGSGYEGEGETLQRRNLPDVFTIPADTFPPTNETGSTYYAPTDFEAVNINVTMLDTTAPSYLTVWPYDSAQPNTSDIDWTPGDDISNGDLVAVSPNLNPCFPECRGNPISSPDRIWADNYTGSADMIIDLNGYFSAVGNPIAPT
jgi:hypothetical protein